VLGSRVGWTPARKERMNADGCGLLLLRQGDKLPMGRGSFGDFLPHWQCIVFWTYTKTAEPIEMPFEMMSGLGLRNSVLREGDGEILGENVPDKPNTPINCKLDWFMQLRAHDRGRRLIANVERLLLATNGGWGWIAHSGQSLMSIIVLSSLCLYVLMLTIINPAHVAQWLIYSAVERESLGDGFKAQSRCLLSMKELFLIMPMHMMKREIISGRERGFDSVFYNL